jgi:hypothetical protein
MPEHDPFSDWSELMHRAVYTADGKKISFLRKVISDYMIVKKGLITLRKYFIPTTLAESVSKKGIRLKITSFEARTQYSSFKSKHFIATFEYVSKPEIRDRPIYDRLQTLRYSTTRNRIAATIAFISGILFLLSGYKANLGIYNLVTQQIEIYTPKDFWVYIITPIGFLALLSQLGGFTVLMGAGLFAANRINLGKLLVVVGTGQGLITIAMRILTELSSGRIAQLGLENNYVTWLTSTATGLGILFAVVAPAIAKGKSESISSKAVRFALRRNKKD